MDGKRDSSTRGLYFKPILWQGNGAQREAVASRYGIRDSSPRGSHFKQFLWQDNGAHREAVRTRDGSRPRDGFDRNVGPRYSEPDNSQEKPPPVLALHGQPYPTLPFSLGGYGLDENTNQLTECRRIGRFQTHRRRPSRHYKSNMPSHTRKRSRSFSSFRRWSETEDRTNHRLVQPQAPSHPVGQRPSKPMNLPERDGKYDQRINVNAAMWQRNAVASLQFEGPQLPFPIERNYFQQPSRSFVPLTYGFPPPRPVPMMNFHVPNPALTTPNRNPRFGWNAEQWMINQLSNASYAPKNVSFRAENATTHAGPSRRW